MEPIIVNYTLAETNEPCITNNTEKLNNSNIIKNVSTDQTEILHSIGLLYNNGSCLFDCDITASTLKFYGRKRGGGEILHTRAENADGCQSVEGRYSQD